MSFLLGLLNRSIIFLSELLILIIQIAALVLHKHSNTNVFTYIRTAFDFKKFNIFKKYQFV